MNAIKALLCGIIISIAAPSAAEEEHPLHPRERAARLLELEMTVERTARLVDRQVVSPLELHSGRGDLHFFNGRFEEALVAYERMAELDPRLASSHWRRGLARYYAGKYDEAARQFEDCHGEDGTDRENGIWQYFAQWKAHGPEQARRTMLRYDRPDRPPFTELYAFFEGRMSGDELLADIEKADLPQDDKAGRLFYAHLYVGLDHSLSGHPDKALPHLRRAVESDWPRRASYGPRYMWWIAVLEYDRAVAAAEQNADGGAPQDRTAALRRAISAIAPDVLIAESDGGREQLSRMLADDHSARRAEANARELAAWRNVKSRADWEKFRDERIAALRRSLGDFPAPPDKIAPQVLGTIDGDGFRIENIVFESRPGLLVTANLYLPAKPTRGIPGIIICHSHHRPKTQGELQDMGMNWARKGCAVLVMDQLGHGERRSHPFASAEDFPVEFAISRQDYHFRYDTGIQLHAIGDSLIGWMVWDLHRGVDLLLGRDDIDPKRIILLGAVAGGGDPAAVAAALDPRIACVVPFNFGQFFGRPAEGDDPEAGYDYFGGGSWESTRNLKGSIRDGFAPWVIDAAPAPNPFVFALEFALLPSREAAEMRIRHIYGEFYGKPEHVARVFGRGNVSLRPPEATHCTNIGAFHREQFYEAFEKWFGIPDPRPEYVGRIDESRLLCLEGEAAKNIERTPLHVVAGRIGDDRSAAFRRQWESMEVVDRWALLRSRWSGALGDVEPAANARLESRGMETAGQVVVERLVLHAERNIRVPALLLKPGHRKDEKERLPVVVAVAQAGKGAFLKERVDVIAALLDAGVAVCLPDLRGTGETDPGSSRERNTPASSLASTEMMFGGTLLGARLRDLRTLLAALRAREDIDGRKIALWGDSFAPINPPGRNVRVPRDVPNMPEQSEPLGHLLVLLCGGLYENSGEQRIAAAASARGGLTSYRDLLESEFVHLPLDAHLPGAIPAGDLKVLALSATPLRLSGLVDGRNQRVSQQNARAAYGERDHVIYAQDAEPDAQLAAWLVEQLNR